MRKFHYVRDHLRSNHRTILVFIHLCKSEKILRFFVPSEGLSDIVSSAELLLWWGQVPVSDSVQAYIWREIFWATRSLAFLQAAKDCQSINRFQLSSALFFWRRCREGEERINNPYTLREQVVLRLLRLRFYQRQSFKLLLNVNHRMLPSIPPFIFL